MTPRMMVRQTLAALAAATLVTGTAWAQGGGKAPPQGQQARPAQTAARQQQMQQQHQQMMTQMQETVQRMTQLQERAHQLAQGAQQQMQNRAQATEQQRLMLRTCEAFDLQAQQMKMLAERAQEMIRSREFQGDGEMQRDMNQLRERLHAMANEMDGALKLMERVRQRTEAQKPE